MDQSGPKSLTNQELLALILGAGHADVDPYNLSESLLSDGGLFGIACLSLSELIQTKNVGPAKATQILAVFEIAKRLGSEAIESKPIIHSPAEAAAFLMGDMPYFEQEHLRVCLLDTRNRIKGIHEVYKGSLNTSLIRVGEVFREAVRRNSAAIIVAHNHPSGDPSPSPEDVAVTRVIVETGKLLDIDVLDHIIIGHGRFVSLKERGLGF